MHVTIQRAKCARLLAELSRAEMLLLQQGIAVVLRRRAEEELTPMVNPSDGLSAEIQQAIREQADYITEDIRNVTDRACLYILIEAALTEQRRLGQTSWQPIETAPKDGTAVLGFGLHSGPQPDAQRGVKAGDYWWAIMLWDIWRNPDPSGWGERSLWVFAKDGTPTWSQPTHWMPLPQPPSSETR